MVEKTENLGEWLTNKARTAAGYTRNILGNAQRSTSTMTIGKMFFYMYDPKHKATLAVYDRFPLVMPIERYEDGWLGLNLHYLGVPARTMLLNELLKYKNNKFMDERTKLSVSYDLLQRVKMVKMAEPAIKRYLNSQVRSQLVEVTPSEWPKAIQLPVAKFVYRNL